MIYMAAKTKTSGKSLVIVESPAKAKTINKYLGPNFKVMASMGHIRDLPGKNMNVDIENDFEPTYEIMPTRQKTLTNLRKALKECDFVYLAADLDREGEAIAWHLTEALKIKPEQFKRVVFNSITKDSIQHAFAHPLNLDMDKVYAQQARRILDRIVGYQISPLLWKKIARGLSAGRVQSVAVKLVVDREKEIKAFIPDEYWKIGGIFCVNQPGDLNDKYKTFLESHDKGKPTQKQKAQWFLEHNCLETQLVNINNKPFKPDNEKDTMAVYNAIKDSDYKVSDINTRQSLTRPSAPFITSTLQQQAANRLGYAAKNTMRLAQNLYEGIEVDGMGSVGLITYMRTDSTQLAPEALNAARGFISGNFGPEYLPAKPNFYGSSNKKAQEAHEAIRPTDVNITPDMIKNSSTPQQHKLYQLIWNRFVSCQMTPAKWNVTTVNIEAKGTDTDNKSVNAIFKASGRVLVFDGFTKIAGLTMTDDQIMPEINIDQQVFPVNIDPTQHFTSPPARYTEASLVKMLEAKGIGRPSTYASIISTIQDREYVEQLEKKFHATDLGIVVTDKLTEHFPRIMDLAFTSHVEEQLDKIEEQHLNWVQVLKDFYAPFKENLDRAHEEMTHAKAETQPSEYKCPECSEPMVYRFGKNGRFLSCGTYPTCKFASPCDRDGKMCGPEETEHKCPNCGKPMILRKGRFGDFLGCQDYPECKTTQKLDKDGTPLPPKAPAKPSGIRCYKCEGELVIRDSKRGEFLGCGRFPRCRTIISMKEFDHLKELQEKGIWPPKTYEEADELLGRKKKKKADDDDSETTTKTKKKTVKKTTKKTVKKTTKKATKKKTAKKTETEPTEDLGI
ncbi:MAG: type I DNA topoisomerase [Phycisphaerae bacterium]|nr:type I DNA topoisomerase [Phycisphaerae bacterium]